MGPKGSVTNAQSAYNNKALHPGVNVSRVNMNRNAFQHTFPISCSILELNVRQDVKECLIKPYCVAIDVEQQLIFNYFNDMRPFPWYLWLKGNNPLGKLFSKIKYQPSLCENLTTQDESVGQYIQVTLLSELHIFWPTEIQLTNIAIMCCLGHFLLDTCSLIFSR